MNNEKPSMPIQQDQRMRTTSPRVDGKRPRMKPRMQNLAEHTSEEVTPVFSTHVVEGSDLGRSTGTDRPVLIKPSPATGPALHE